METNNPHPDPYILIEFNGTQRAILREKLPEAEQMAADMRALAIKAGHTPEQAEQLFTLRIVRDES